MSWRSIGILAAVLLVLAVVLALQHGLPGSPAGGTASSREGDRLFPSLDVNQVAGIEIVAPDGARVLARRDGRWVVESLYGYPADFSRLASFLREIGELKAGQVMRGGDLLLEEFGLDQESAEQPPTVLVLRDGEGGELARLALGAPRLREVEGPYGAMPDGRYVRAAGGSVMLVRENLERADGASEEWIERDLLDVSADNVEWIRVTAPGGAYRLRPLPDGEFVLEGLEEEREELEVSQAGRLARALRFLRCSTVADPELDAEATGFGEAVRYQMKTSDGFFYTALIGAEAPGGEGRYARFAVAYQAPPPPEPADVDAPAPAAEAGAGEALPEGGEESALDSREDPADQGEETFQEVLRAFEEAGEKDRDRARRLQERLSPWTYVISTYAAESLTLPREQLVKVRETEEAALSEDGGQP